MPNDQSILTLHMHPLASYCWKVLVALYESELPFRSMRIDGMPKDNKAFADLWPLGPRNARVVMARDNSYVQHSRTGCLLRRNGHPVAGLRS